MTTVLQRNAIIDGWRGISVSLVIVGHLIGYRLPSAYPLDGLNSLGFALGSRMFNVLSSLGVLGVSIFFAISGFLITSLLVAEEAKHSRVSIKAFYVRRVFRIMPAFYFYVFSVWVLHRFGLIFVNETAFVRSSAYICNFSGYSCSWWLAHTWSLAVEEQFYLSWPMLFVLALGLRREIVQCLFVGVTIGSLFVPEIRGFSYILIGVLTALWPAAQRLFARTGGLAIWAALGVLLVAPVTSNIPVVREAVQIAQPFLVAIVLFGTVLGSGVEKLRGAIQHPVLVKIGLVSYSLYLWQQLSLAPMHWGGMPTGASILYDGIGLLLMVAFVPIAIASYFLLEKPLVAIGHGISRRIIERESKRRRIDATLPANVP